MSLIEELKRRNVIRVGLAYAITAWLATQILEIVLETFGAPAWVMKAVLVILATGMPFALIFAWAFEMTPEGLKKEKDVDRTKSIAPHTGRKLDFTIIGVMAVALIYFATDKFLLNKEGSNTAAVEGSIAETLPSLEDAEIVATAKSIAVLPFVNMSEDSSNEFFSDGISEEILNALAKVRELKVAGRTSSFAFKGENQDLREIGDLLGVQHILEGSVRKSGDRIRVTAQLIQVSDGFHLWSESYDRELTDIFAIQDEISQAILVELKATLLGNQKMAATHTDTTVYENYLLARQRIYDRRESSLKLAVDLLDKAIAIDPAYAPAYAQRAIATMLLSDDSYGQIPKLEAGETALGFIDQALAMDPALPEAMAAKGLYLENYTHDYRAAVEVLQAALDINPNLTNASTWLSTALADLGEIQESMRILEITHARDPLHPPTSNNLIVRYSQTGQSARAMALLERLQANNPNDPDLLKSEGDIKIEMGDLAGAIEALEKARASDPLNSSGNLALGFTQAQIFNYDRALEVGARGVKILALNRLGRIEEATILGMELASTGNVTELLFQVMVENGDYQALIEFLEARWPDLDAFETEYPSIQGFGSAMFGYIAQSYGSLGQEEQFEDAMSRYKAQLDHQLNQGVNNPFFDFSRAYYFMLAGDHENAITQLEKSFAKGNGFNFDIPTAWPVFKPLDGDPRYEKAKTEFIEYINNERAKLNMEPVTT